MKFRTPWRMTEKAPWKVIDAAGITVATFTSLELEYAKELVERVNLADAWKQAVIDELANCHMLQAKHETDPRQAIHDAISWHVAVSLDPSVSEEARRLRDQAYELAAIAAWNHFMETCKNCGLPPAAYDKWLAAGAIRKLKQEQILPNISARFETEGENMVGTTDAPVKRIEAHDDGSFTVVIDHWPRKEPEGHVVITRNERGQIAVVTRQDDEGKILKVIAETRRLEGGDKYKHADGGTYYLIGQANPAGTAKDKIGGPLSFYRGEDGRLWYRRPEEFAERFERPCKGPYCECEQGKCTHPGFFDARSEA